MNYLNESIIDLLEYLSVPAFMISLNNNRIIATNSRMDRKYPNVFAYGTKVELLDDPKMPYQKKYVNYRFEAKKLLLSCQLKDNSAFVLNYVNESTIIASELKIGITSTRSFRVQNLEDNENFCHYELTPYHFNYTYDFAFNNWQLSNPEQLLENGMINSLADLENFSWRNHICEEDRVRYDLAMKSINLNGGNHEIHYNIVLPNGKLNQVCDYCGVIKKDDGWPLIVGSIVSGERALCEIYQAQQDAMTGKLIGGMVHDFKNLLSGIHNVIEWASVVSQEEKIVEALHKTLDYTNQANYLISNTLKLNSKKNGNNNLITNKKNSSSKVVIPSNYTPVIEQNLSNKDCFVNSNIINKKKSVNKIVGDNYRSINKKNSIDVKTGNKLTALKGLFGSGNSEHSKEEYNTRTRAIAVQPLSEKIHFNLGKLVISLSELVVKMVPESIVLIVEVEEDLPYIYGARRELQNMLLNLCLNARDAMNEKGGELTIQLSSEKVSSPLTGGYKRNIVLTVKDTGCGMARGQYEKVLQPYYSNKKTGSGLGLWMVKNTVDSLDGKLIIKSKVGLGSTFIIKIPAVEKSFTDDEKFFNTLNSVNLDKKSLKSQRTKRLNLRKKFEKPVADKSDSDDYSLVENLMKIVKENPKKILYIEDNELIRYSTASYLRSLGLEIIEAIDGIKGEEYFVNNAHDIDFIIQDYILPGKGGYELFKSLKEHNKDIPILICSANPDDDAMRDILEAGACGLISKPFKFNELLTYLVDEFQ